jgi:hypothetical protein
MNFNPAFRAQYYNDDTLLRRLLGAATRQFIWKVGITCVQYLAANRSVTVCSLLHPDVKMDRDWMGILVLTAEIAKWNVRDVKTVYSQSLGQSRTGCQSWWSKLCSAFWSSSVSSNVNLICTFYVEGLKWRMQVVRRSSEERRGDIAPEHSCSVPDVSRKRHLCHGSTVIPSRLSTWPHLTVGCYQNSKQCAVRQVSGPLRALHWRENILTDNAGQYFQNFSEHW